MAVTTRNQQFGTTNWKAPETKIINGLPVRFSDVCVHQIIIGDIGWTGNPDVLLNWQNSELRKWAIENTVEKLYWIQHMDTDLFGHVYKVIARFSEQNQTFLRLKWGELN